MSLSFLGTWAGGVLVVREGSHRAAAGRRGKSSCLEAGPGKLCSRAEINANRLVMSG